MEKFKIAVFRLLKWIYMINIWVNDILENALDSLQNYLLNSFSK